MSTQPFNKKQSMELVTATQNIAVHYNDTGFLNDSPGALKAWQVTLKDSHKLHKYLFEVSGGADAAYMGLSMVVKMLLRLSHLIHNGEKETDLDRGESYQRFVEKYGRRPKLEQTNKRIML